MATLRRYKLGNTINASGNASDTFTAQRPGVLRGIQFHIGFDSVTDGASVRIQVSRSAQADIPASGGAISNSLGEFHQYGNFVTSGLSQTAGNLLVDCNDRILLGESLYVNAVIAGTVNAIYTIILLIEEA